MNAVKKEEEPTPLGFSATRLGLDRTLEKQRLSLGATTQAGTLERERH